jgi:DNA polymerase III delta prime subunit
MVWKGIEMVSVSELLFTEKYRPKKLDDIVSDDKEKLRNYINNPQNMPNLLLVSRSPGTGKSSLAKIIINELQAESMILNASDDNGIEVIRDRIKNYARSLGFTGKRKVIVLDEVDAVTKPAQMALRAMMEEYASNVMFILTCNFETKLIEPIISRCVKIDFSKPNKQQAVLYLTKICGEEKIEWEEGTLVELLNTYYPSLRDCVNFLQDLKTSGKPLTHDAVIKETDGSKLIELLKAKDYEMIRQKIFVGDIDVLHANQFLWKHVNNEEMTTEKKIKLIQILANNERDFSFGVDNNIVFVSRIPELLKVME